METRRFFGDQFVSNLSLMRDGSELAALQELKSTSSEAERLKAVARVVQPYIQFVTEDSKCAYTGLLLRDVWRYFRHTWASPHKSIPGRTMQIMVRDAAAENHPVIGIAALSSAAVAVTARDRWIGWNTRSVLSLLRESPSSRLAAWLQRIVDDAIDDLFLPDFFEDGMLEVGDVRLPSPDVVSRLEKESREQREAHYRFMQSRDYKKNERPIDSTDDHWVEQARSHLFRSKRAYELSRLLRLRIVLSEFFGGKPTRARLLRMLDDGRGRDAIGRIVRQAKSGRVGTTIADLTVCGAVPPYSEILGGKLVAALMASPEVVQEYRRRYEQTPSVIASSMAGRPLVRPASLVFIGTTSLFGQRPSQYDRVSMQLGVAERNRQVKIGWKYLGRTLGLGTFHFGEETVAKLAVLLAQSRRGQKVNSVFGEGVNPRLRKIRDGLDELGLPADELLTHGGSRLVYGMPLIRNLREYLLGIDHTPKYIVDQRKSSRITDEIIDWWRTRWVLKRIQRDDVFERMASHRLVHPIRHGARVPLPRLDRDQLLLFSDELREHICFDDQTCRATSPHTLKAHTTNQCPRCTTRRSAQSPQMGNAIRRSGARV